MFVVQLLFARGSLVELLISSNIARYAEFRSVSRVLTWLDGRLETVPCSRADVFATKHVTVVEKRMLMKLLTLCVEYTPDTNEFDGKFQCILFLRIQYVRYINYLCQKVPCTFTSSFQVCRHVFIQQMYKLIHIIVCVVSVYAGCINLL